MPIDAGSDDLVTPCGDAVRAADPVRLPEGPTLAVTLSGGGFRATLAALGVLRFLADAGLLHRVRFVSSVSGGSITNGVLACHWAELRDRQFAPSVLERLVVEPIVDSISKSSMKAELIRNLWRTVGRRTRTDVLADVLDRRFFAGRELESLDSGCRFVINAANLVTGVRFAFERDVIGDYVVGRTPTAGSGVRVATAVAASAAVPGAFPPLVLRDLDFPCRSRVGDPELLDGGTYDNTGLQAFDPPRYGDLFLVCMNAGGVFTTGAVRGVPIIRDLLRANSLLYRQSTALRTSWMVDRFRTPRGGSAPPEWAREGVLVGLGTRFAGIKAAQWPYPENRIWDGKDLSRVPTVFDHLPRELCQRLVYHGWWLIGAAVSHFHPDLLPTSLPDPPFVSGRST
jgi:NTE family protein